MTLGWRTPAADTMTASRLPDWLIHSIIHFGTIRWPISVLKAINEKFNNLVRKTISFLTKFNIRQTTPVDFGKNPCYTFWLPGELDR